MIFLSEIVFAQSDEYKINNIKKEYIGTYIPVDLELRLYQSKKFSESLYASRKYGKTKPHDVLYLQENICYSDLAFHDGYEIQNKEFKNYKFITDKNNVFCIDNNGYLYRKISDSDYGYKEYEDHMGNTKAVLISRFSGMFELKENELPDYSTVTKKTLRLLRNLVFARNGYVFKSKDLQGYFN